MDTRGHYLYSSRCHARRENTEEIPIPVFSTKTILQSALFTLCLGAANGLFAHGSVTPDGDICYIEFGFYSAHFKIYQPRETRYEEFCEDIPNVTESVFVMEYLHDSLREVPIDFRIVRDTQERGRFVSWDDLADIDLDAITVFHQPAVVKPDGVYALLHEFSEAGDHIGIVTTVHPTEDIVYHAVFPFRVGGFKWGSLPLFLGLAVGLLLLYWLMNGGYARLRQREIRQSNNPG